MQTCRAERAPDARKRVQETAMYTLYYNPGTASMCVHQALIEANAPYRLVLVDLQAGQ